jgi:hypothetical protein
MSPHLTSNPVNLLYGLSGLISTIDAWMLPGSFFASSAETSIDIASNPCTRVLEASRSHTRSKTHKLNRGRIASRAAMETASLVVSNGFFREALSDILASN